MNRRLAAAGAVTALVTAGALSAASGAAAGTHSHKCGTIRGPLGVTAANVVVSGRLTCAAARRAIQSPKSPSKLGYRCKSRSEAMSPASHVTCVGHHGKISFLESQGR